MTDVVKITHRIDSVADHLVFDPPHSGTKVILALDVPHELQVRLEQ